jgi:hypothetical protein
VIVASRHDPFGSHATRRCSGVACLSTIRQIPGNFSKGTAVAVSVNVNNVHNRNNRQELPQCVR